MYFFVVALSHILYLGTLQPASGENLYLVAALNTDSNTTQEQRNTTQEQRNTTQEQSNTTQEQNNTTAEHSNTTGEQR